MALFRRSQETPNEATSTPEPTVDKGAAPRKKTGPTRSRREAERERAQRLHPNLSPKEARKLAAQKNREARMSALAERDKAPERTLMRNHVDNRFNLGELLLPLMILVLAMTFFQQKYPQVTYIALILMYGLLLAVLIDLVVMWYGFKRRVAREMPGFDPKRKGLATYGANRAIQLRAVRQPKPTIARGELNKKV